MRLALVQTVGITLSGGISPEDIVENLDAVMDLSGAGLRDLENPPH
jgi:hypothetical protein